MDYNASAKRIVPYKNFKFRVKWDGTYVAGVTKVSGLTRKTEVISFREGGDPSMVHLTPGQTTWEPITLERGVTHDTEFEKWAQKVWAPGGGPGAESSLKDFRKDLTIEVHNEAGQVVLAYNVFNCWVSEFRALPDLDASANAVAIQSMTIAHEGWQRDAAVQAPQLPSFDGSI